MRHGLALLVLLAFVSLSTSCSTIQKPSGPRAPELGLIQSNDIPEPGVFYHIITPPFLYITDKAGPKSIKSSQAWCVANEFVFRTALRNVAVLPACSVYPGESGYRMRFEGKEGASDLQVFVREDLKAARWIKE